MKIALVTGGTKGIGLAVVKMLLAKKYYVVLTYSHDTTAAIECNNVLSEFKGSYEIVKASQDNIIDMNNLVKRIHSLGVINCIICNAGTTLRKELVSISNEEWNKVMDINVNSNVFLIRDLFDIIVPNSRIVFIGSLMGIHPHATSLAYGVTKSAVHALAKNMVKCFEGSGTTVNAIAPGFVETEWQKNKPVEIRKNIYNKTANKRFASVEEIAAAVRFCIDNPYVNGSIIEISGGYSFK